MNKKNHVNYLPLLIIVLTKIFICLGDSKLDLELLHDDIIGDVEFNLLCEGGIPLLEENDKPRNCFPYSTLSYLQCPPNFWCHIGTTNLTNFCCPVNQKVKSACDIPVSKGHGSATLKRFFFDSQTKTCRKMTYTGFGGNQNNFLSEMDCQRACPTIAQKQPSLKSTARVDAEHSEINIKQQQDICELPPEKGYAKENREASFKWYFDNGVGQCVQFYYQGFLGNGNKFDDEISCRTACAHKIRTKSTVSAVKETTVYTVPSVMTTYSTAEKYFITTTPSSMLKKNQNNTQFISTTEINGNLPFGGRFHHIVDSNKTKEAEDHSAKKEETTIITAQDSQLSSDNPCLKQFSDNTNLFQGCALKKEAACPQGTFCQIGETLQQSFCCPLIGGERCKQLPDPGVGIAVLGRWYFDHATKQCNTIIFKGYRANENNFLDFKSCQDACDAINPCRVGEPTMQNDAKYRCSPNNRLSCPENYFCRVVDQSGSTICCPNEEVPNAKSKIVAPTVDNLPNMGIQNKGFITGQMGIDRIANLPLDGRIISPIPENPMQKLINPCNSGAPLIIWDRLVHCSFMNFGICPSSHYCHLGESMETTVCCPASGRDKCTLPVKMGVGNAKLKRFYFNKESSKCQPFFYAGRQGNENNFISLMECKKYCPEFDNPCPFGLPFVNLITRNVEHCTRAGTCPPDYWCHVGANLRTTVCCPKSYPNLVNGQMRIGTSDLISQQPFQYPSMNTRQVLYSPQSLKYHPPIPLGGDYFSPCTLPLATGGGTFHLSRFYYNSQTRTCQPFIYSGKGGNQNNFLTKMECEEECPILENPCANGYPSTTAEGNPVLCSIAMPDICDEGFYCHIGAAVETTVCCPGTGDPCGLPLSKGNGEAVLNRWYFNSESKTCLSFAYSGAGGNQNNFISRKDCVNACPEFVNPCVDGFPHVGLSGQITHCGASGPSICPATHWCHIGASLETSVCCPGTLNPCEQTVRTGNGTERLLRFYYDQVGRRCQQFHYTGLSGNSNNFITLKACESRCPVVPNPCANGQPELDEYQNSVLCSAADESSCSPSYFCHIGDTEQTTVCCPGKSTNPCTEPRIDGHGKAALNRYFYSPLTKQCLLFAYTGIGGNENNFLSKASCEATCPVVPNPCSEGDPARGENNQYIMCVSKAEKVCPDGYWCHIGADMATSLCCPGIGNPCEQPRSEGRGNDSLVRWYFDSNTRRCIRFNYAGYGGNQNNFQTQRECQLKCPELGNPCGMGDPAVALTGGVQYCNAVQSNCPPSYYCHVGSSFETSVCCPAFGDPCLAPMAEGTGSTALMRWYFNQNTRQCLPFTYSGMGGNENNFLTVTACVNACPVFRNPCPNNIRDNNYLTIIKCSSEKKQSCPLTHWCHIGATSETTVCCPGSENPCDLPMVKGFSIQSKILNRWYYDKFAKSCKRFQYNGFGGNQNNFLTREECSAKCSAGVSCQNGLPLKEFHGGIQHCSAKVPCPPNYFCQFGKDELASACCPIGGITIPCTGPNCNSPMFSPHVGKQYCPKGKPLMSAMGLPIVCSLNQINYCTHIGYRCIPSLSGDSYCCPEQEFFCSSKDVSACIPNGISDSHYAYNPLTDSCERKIIKCSNEIKKFSNFDDCMGMCSRKSFIIPSLNDYKDDYSQISKDSNTTSYKQEEWNLKKSDLVTDNGKTDRVETVQK